MKREPSLQYINCRIKKLSKEILVLTDQQAKHRARVEQGDTDKYIARFIRVVNIKIQQADRQMQELIIQKERLCQTK